MFQPVDIQRRFIIVTHGITPCWVIAVGGKVIPYPVLLAILAKPHGDKVLLRTIDWTEHVYGEKVTEALDVIRHSLEEAECNENFEFLWKNSKKVNEE